MAKVTFNDESIKIRPQNQKFPKLSKLEAGEKVRIQLVDPDNIEVDFVHNLERPKIENGEVVRNDKGDIQKQYMGSPLSLGDINELLNSGVDAKNCPISAFAKKHPDWVGTPRRKFAMHIVQYKTKPSTHNIAKPFQVEHKIWVFTDKTYQKLKDYAQEWGDLRQHDLLITCENKQFQQYDITVAGKAEWLQGEGDEQKERIKDTMAVYNAGMEEFDDLSLAIGQRKERQWIEADLREIEEAWNEVQGKAATNANSASLDEDLSGLLGGGSSEPQGQTEWKSDDEEKKDNKPAAKADTTDIDDLLNGM